MQGLERIYDDLDSIRSRVSKLSVMERITSHQRDRILKYVIPCMEYVSTQLPLESVPEEDL